jgi:hypothetical protein
MSISGFRGNGDFEFCSVSILLIMRHLSCFPTTAVHIENLIYELGGRKLFFYLDIDFTYVKVVGGQETGKPPGFTSAVEP